MVSVAKTTSANPFGQANPSDQSQIQLKIQERIEGERFKNTSLDKEKWRREQDSSFDVESKPIVDGKEKWARALGKNENLTAADGRWAREAKASNDDGNKSERVVVKKTEALGSWRRSEAVKVREDKAPIQNKATAYHSVESSKEIRNGISSEILSPKGSPVEISSVKVLNPFALLDEN